MESLVSRLGEGLQYTIWENVLKILNHIADYVSKYFNTIFCSKHVKYINFDIRLFDL